MSEEICWMPARVAYEMTLLHYSQVPGIGREREGIEDAASNILLGKLNAGLIAATADSFEYGRINGRLRRWNVWYPMKDGKIPKGFWKELHVIGAASGIDWINGDFHFTSPLNGFWKEHWTGHALGVRLEQTTFEATVLSALGPSAVKSLSEQATVNPSAGRKPANWWPDVAEELAFILHERGLPETQEALISAIQSAVIAKGRAEPSRSQLQPVVRAIFSRVKGAGNQG